MAWWIWGFICWAAITTLAVLWLGAVCWRRRRRSKTVEPVHDVVSVQGLVGEEIDTAEAPSPPTRTTQPLLDLPPGATGRDLLGTDMPQSLLGRLADGARRGDYTLPGRLLHLQRAAALLADLDLPRPAHLGRDQAAARLVSAALDSQPLDPVGLCAEMHRARTDRLLFQEALELVRSATLQAEDAAVREAAEASDAIIAEHLRPAFHETMHRAGEAARRLGPYLDDEFRLDTARIITASLKVRNAFLALPDLVRRHSSILAAREVANALGERTPQCDRRALFSLFERPLAFASDGVPYDEFPGPPVPRDETARLLWLLSDEAAAGRPWLPTVAEQDTAWRAHFGRAAEISPLVASE